MFPGYAAAFGFVFLLIVGIYCFGYAARQASLLHVLLLETFLGVVLIFPLLFLEKGTTLHTLFSRLPTANLLWLGGAALCGFAGGNYFSLMNLRTAGEKVNSLLSPAITALSMVLGFFILDDRLQPLQWMGAALTLAVITHFLANRKTITGKTYHHQAALWSSIAVVVLMSLGIVGAIRGATGNVPFLQAIWVRLLFALAIVATVYLARREYREVKPQDATFYGVVLGGVVAQTILAPYLWLYASFSVGFSTVQVIVATLPLWVYALDVYVFKKSPSSARFMLVSALALIGILLVMW